MTHILTAQQIEDSVSKGGTQPEIAARLGISERTLRRKLADLREIDAVTQYSQTARIKGTSTLYKTVSDTGEKVMTWIKTAEPKTEIDLAGLFDATLKAYADRIPHAAPAHAPKITDSDLLNAVVLTDCHVNMKSWGEETGADWDISIAESVINGAFDNLLNRLPQADTMLIVQNGDWLHADGNDPVTPASKHLLDTDTRFGKAIDVSIRMFRRMIQQGLGSHKRVHFMLNGGNHDPISSLWFKRMLPLIYEKEPRVTFSDTDSTYSGIQWGNTALFGTHGHKRKLEQLPELLAARFPVMWGTTKYRYCFTGHYHSHKVIERSGIKLIQCPTITAQDAYAHHGGWDSLREVVGFTFSKTFGELGTITVRPSMIGEQE